MCGDYFKQHLYLTQTSFIKKIKKHRDNNIQ